MNDDLLSQIRQKTFDAAMDEATKRFCKSHPSKSLDLARSAAGAIIASFDLVYRDAIGHPYRGSYSARAIEEALTAALVNASDVSDYARLIGTKPVLGYLAARFLHGDVFDAVSAESVTFSDYARHLQTDSFFRKIGVRDK